MKRYDYYPELRTCHDVRRLAPCERCKGMGDKRHMVPVGSGRAREHLHGRCYVKSYGLEAMLMLPRDITDTLYLDDIGGKTMTALMNRGKK